MDQRLLDAAISDSVNVIEQPYDNAQHLHSTTAQGNTALHLAIRFGNRHFAAQIHKLCPDLLGWQNVNGETPLHCAAACGWPHIWHWAVDVINTTSADSNDEAKRTFRKSSRHGETALHVALKNRNEIMAKSLLRADFGLSDCINNAGESVIYLAANFGYVDIVKKLLQSPSTTDHTGLLGRSPLHGALRAGNIGVVEIILEKRSGDVKRTDETGSTPMHYAVSLNYVDLVEMLLKCDPSAAYDVTTDGNSPAHLAAQMGFVKVLEKILDYCPDCIDVVDAMGRNALHVAIDNGKLDVAKHILGRRGLEGVVNQQDNNGDTPLHIIASKCEADILKELTKCNRLKRLNIRIENHEGHTVIESLPRVADAKEIQKHIKVGTVLYAVHSSLSPNDRFSAVAVETLKKRLLDTIIGYRRSAFDHRTEKKSIVATLIATVTFAAAFSIPGGYFGDDGPNQGLAILSKQSAFKAFLVFDTLALILSLTTVIAATLSDEWVGKYSTIIRWSTDQFVAASLLAVISAFGTGVYVVVAPISPSLANSVLVTCCLSVFILIVLHVRAYCPAEFSFLSSRIQLSCTTYLASYR